MTSATEHHAGPAAIEVGRRIGSLVAAALNGVMLWVTHQLLDWEWPSFLTAEFDDLLPWVTASFVVSIVVDVLYVVDDRVRVKASGDLLTAAVGLVVAVRTWQVFPFDFSSWARDWSWAIRVALVVGMVATSIGVVVALVRLLSGRDGAGRPSAG